MIALTDCYANTSGSFHSKSQSHKIIGCVGQQLWCHFLNCRPTRLSVLSCLSPSLGCSNPPWAPCEPLLDKSHYPSLLLFRKLIIPSITSGLSDNRMNMPSHRLIRSLWLEFVGEHNSSPRHYISCNYLSNMTSSVWHLILLLVIIDSLFGVHTHTFWQQHNKSSIRKLGGFGSVLVLLAPAWVYWA